ncbi:lysophospholipid acyltransferase family protein [Parabacteroides sp. AD58]|uniref:Lysophospholipid acyltransferase family protein n=1 Tax=Parabacteroides absconsus TaxID=2951805 RepID=A0ABZ2IGF1_9BACT|nr:lysophospholipid acyltransferase family protein [Parabacteroides sp. AD58]MCM6903193.1 lysophospholipid acyltransferase family protein [Parabacteroides sp. AD58]
MWTRIQYILIYGWIKIHALLPMRLLYVLSDFLYLIISWVIRYRVPVVRKNLKSSFPDKSEEELRQLEKAFYHHFADYIVETLKLAHISLQELQERAYVQNPELIDKLMDNGHPCCLFLMGHYGNWEWYSGSNSRFKDARLYQIYRPLNNKAVDKIFIHLRTKFGSLGIPKNDTGREVVRLVRNKVRSGVVFLADQTPSPSNLHYWTNFLNQDTSVLTGAERLARKLNTPVVFLDVQMVKRGYYTLEIQLITENPKETPENWITEEYARCLEKSILRKPEGWLWTHKRWKYKRSDAVIHHGNN